MRSGNVVVETKSDSRRHSDADVMSREGTESIVSNETFEVVNLSDTKPDNELKNLSRVQK